ncbi:hypothetical protein D3C81_2254010 [compost metagenome]
MALHQLDIGAGEDAALGDHQAILRNPRQQVEGGLQRHLEAVQVAVVDAEQRGVQVLERALELGAVVHLD